MNVKKALSLLLTFCMLAGMVPGAFAAGTSGGGSPSAYKLTGTVAVAASEAANETVYSKATNTLTENLTSTYDSSNQVYALSGTVKYVTGFTGYDNDVQKQSGHYVALKVTVTDSSFGNGDTASATVKVTTGSGAALKSFVKTDFTTSNNTHTLMLAVRLEDVTSNQFAIQCDWNNDGTIDATYTFGTGALTQVTIGAPAVSRIGISETVLGKPATDLIESTVSLEPPVAGQDSVYTLSGTVKYVSGWTQFDSTNTANQSGNYVAMTFTKPTGLSTSTTAKVSTSTNVASAATNTPSFFTDSATSGTLVVRLNGITADSNGKKIFTVTFDWDGQTATTADRLEYKFDVTGLTLTPANPANPTLTVGVFGGTNLLPGTTPNSGKNAADLMGNVLLGTPVVNGKSVTYKPTGTVRYVSGWEGFSSTLDQQKGFYLALTFDKSNSPLTSTYKVTVNGTENKVFTAGQFFTEDNGTKETLVMRLDGIHALTDAAKKDKFTVSFDWDGDNVNDIIYTFDVSAMEFKAETVVKPSVDDTTGTATSTVDKSTIESAIAGAINDSNNSGVDAPPTVVIDVSGSTASKAEVQLPADVIKALRDAVNGTDTTLAVPNLTLKVETQVGTIEVDKAVIQALASVSGPVSLKVEKADNAQTAPPAGIPSADVKSEEVYEISFETAGGDTIDVSGGSISMTLRFTTDDPDNVRIGWKNADGTIGYIENVTPAPTGTPREYDFSFTVTHLTAFYLAPVAPVTPPYTGPDNSGGSSSLGNSTPGGGGGGGGGGGSSSTNAPDVSKNDGGSVKTSSDGKTVTITPDSGYRVLDVIINGKSMGSITKYVFEKASKDNTVEVIFEKISDASGDTGDDETPSFADAESHWAREAIAFVVERGLFNGVSDTQFAPNSTMTRAMLVTVLHRLAGTPAASGAMSFSDVEDGQWYSQAVLWASQSQLVNGTGAGFEPNGNVTREQLAVILYRFAQMTGADTSASGSLARFGDSANVSDWAQEALAWAVGAGIINGTNTGDLNPGGSATRAEVATMLMRFVEFIG